MKTTTDTAMLSFCFEEAMRTAADREHRSIASVLMRNYRGSNSIAIQKRRALPFEDLHIPQSIKR